MALFFAMQKDGTRSLSVLFCQQVPDRELKIIGAQNGSQSEKSAREFRCYNKLITTAGISYNGNEKDITI